MSGGQVSDQSCPISATSIPSNSAHLHRHLAVVFQILREVHRGHAAGPQLVLDGVAVGEGSFETVEKVRHYVLAPLATLLEYGLGS